MGIVCPVCGEKSAEYAFTLRKIDKAWNVYECGDCLVQFIFPIPSDNELRGLYHKFYSNHGEGLNQLLNPNYGRFSFPRQWGIIEGLTGKKQGKILDFGCGGGHFLARVSDSWRKYGVEISGIAREVTSQKGIVTLESLDALKHWSGFFDVVTMFATIEHLSNPREIVAELSRLLKVGGLFAIMTGDVGSVKAKIQGERWHLYTPPGHIYFFTARSVDCLMESLGFRKVKSLYTDGGVTRIPFMPLNMMLRVGLEAYFRLPMLNRMPLFDTYYGWYRKV